MKESLNLDNLIHYKQSLQNQKDKALDELQQLKSNYSNITKETERREAELRDHIIHLNTKAFNRDFHLIKTNINSLSSQINDSIVSSYRNGKTTILNNMQNINLKKEILMKESMFLHSKMLDAVERQQETTKTMIVSNIESNLKLKRNYKVLEEKCLYFYELLDVIVDRMKKLKEKNNEVYYYVYEVNKVFGILKAKCGVVSEKFVTLYGGFGLNDINNRILEIENKDKEAFEGVSLDSKLGNTSYRVNEVGSLNSTIKIKDKYNTQDKLPDVTNNSSSKNSINSVIKISQNKDHKLKSLKQFTKAKITNKIISNLLNMLEYKKKENTKLLLSIKKPNFYITTLFELVNKTKQTSKEEFISKPDRKVLIDLICSSFIN